MCNVINYNNIIQSHRWYSEMTIKCTLVPFYVSSRMAYETTGEGLEQIFFFLLFITIAMFFIAQQSFVNYINHVHIVDCLFIFDTAAIFSYLMLLLSHITCQFNHAAYIVNLQQKRGAFQTEDGIGVSTILCSKHNGSKR